MLKILKKPVGLLCFLRVIEDHHEEGYAFLNSGGAEHLMLLDLRLRDPLESRSTKIVKSCNAVLYGRAGAPHLMLVDGDLGSP